MATATGTISSNGDEVDISPGPDVGDLQVDLSGSWVGEVFPEVRKVGSPYWYSLGMPVSTPGTYNYSIPHTPLSNYVFRVRGDMWTSGSADVTLTTP